MRWRLLLLLLALAWAAAAKPPSQLREELDSVRKKLKLSQAKLKEANAREQDLSDQLGATEVQLKKFSQRLELVRTQLNLARGRHNVVRKQVQDSRELLRKKRKALGRRLREMELEGSANYLQVLLQARTFTQFVTYGEYVQRLLDSEKRLIAEVKKEKEIFEMRREAAQRTVNEIAALEQDYKERVLELDGVLKRQSQLLGKLQAHRQKLEKYVVGLEHLSLAMEKKLQDLIAARTTSSGPSGPILPGTGQFMFPVSGPITSPFGYRIHPVMGTTRFHSGLDFGVDQGTAIKAADNGVVIVAEWYGGYGNCLIIDHGNSLTTLYGHCSQLYVKQGDGVRKGQAVAAVGSTGMSTGPHLHFEVRQAGTPVDPLGYL
jgi:murein DD-endopeptidase MepM/ murein hydrolase activator NlpD